MRSARLNVRYRPCCCRSMSAGTGRRPREAAAANLAAQPPRPANYGLKNPLLDDGPGGVDVPAFTVTMEPASAPLRPYADAEPLQATVRDSPTRIAASGYGGQWFRPGADVPTRPVAVVERRRTPKKPSITTTRCGCADWRSGIVHLAGCGSACTVPSLEKQPIPGPSRALCCGIRGRATDAGTASGPRPPCRSGGAAAAPRGRPVVLTRRWRLVCCGQAKMAGSWPPWPICRCVRLYAREHPEWLAPRDGRTRLVERTLGTSKFASFTGRCTSARPAATCASRSRYSTVGNFWQRCAGGQEFTTTGDWRAEWGDAPLMLTAAMPPLAGRLFAEIPSGWESWRRVARWPALAGRPPVRFRLALDRPARRGARLEVLAVGAAPTVTGATVLAREPRCLETRPCDGTSGGGLLAAPGTERGRHRPDAGCSTVAGPPPFPTPITMTSPTSSVWASELVWRDPPPTTRAASVRLPPAEVTVRDRAGAVLLERSQPTETAWALGLAALVGLDPAHEGAVGYTLARLSDHGVTAVDARLTVDAKIQTAARRALLGRLPAVSTAF